MNHLGSAALARAATELGVQKFVYASTGLVYRDGIGRPSTEDDATGSAPQYLYRVSKLAGECAIVSVLGSSFTSLCILRLAFVDGDGDPHLRDWMPRLGARPGNALFQLLHHVDVVKAVSLALSSHAPGKRIYNVADDEPLPVAEVQRLLGHEPSVDDPNLDAGQRWSGIMDARKIRAELGFAPRFASLASAIEEGAL